MYSTFADIYLAPNGFRRLILNGYRFGERGECYYDEPDPIPGSVWRCTSNIFNKETGKKRKCTVRVHTKVIDGYEMIRNAMLTHHHDPPKNNLFSSCSISNK